MPCKAHEVEESIWDVQGSSLSSAYSVDQSQIHPRYVEVCWLTRLKRGRRVESATRISREIWLRQGNNRTDPLIHRICSKNSKIHRLPHLMYLSPLEFNFDQTGAIWVPSEVLLNAYQDYLEDDVKEFLSELGESRRIFDPRYSHVVTYLEGVAVQALRHGAVAVLSWYAYYSLSIIDTNANQSSTGCIYKRSQEISRRVPAHAELRYLKTYYFL